VVRWHRRGFAHYWQLLRHVNDATHRPAYEAARDTVLVLGDTMATRSGVNKQGVDVFEIYWTKVRTGELPNPWR
jgi:hypothetical protein